MHAVAFVVHVHPSMCTSSPMTGTGKTSADAAEPADGDQPRLRPSKSSSSISSESSNASSSSCSTSFSERDSEWYLDVVLGFAEPPVSAAAFRPYRFPSKLGGRPVWLYFGHSRPHALRCGVCGGVLAFLLQLYAPINGLDQAFHRVIYLFVCRSRGCAGGVGAARVLVAQLPRENPFYPYDPLDNDEAEKATLGVPPGMEQEPGCELCSFAGSSRCGKCSSARYCSRDCQKIDWRLAHRDSCRLASNTPATDGASVATEQALNEAGEKLAETAPRSAVVDEAAVEKKRLSWLFKEYEIVNDSCPTPGGGSECGSDGESSDGEGDTSGNGARSKTTPSLQDASKEELPSSLFKQGRRGENRNEDSTFRRFSDMMRDAPSQIVRYWRGGRVLWCARDGRPTGRATGATGATGEEKRPGANLNHPSTASCARCSGPLLFEAQVMSQVLYYIGVDGSSDSKRQLRSDSGGSSGLNFGTIALFTCAAGCGAGNDGTGHFRYSEEVAWVQCIDESSPSGKKGSKGRSENPCDVLKEGTAKGDLEE